MADFNYFKEKILLLDKEFRYEFNKDAYELYLYTDDSEELKELVRKEFINIQKMNNVSIKTNDLHFEFHIKKCKYAFNNKITFIIDYRIEYFTSEYNLVGLSLKSNTINKILHPSNYFYEKPEVRNVPTIYDEYTMKKFNFKFFEESVNCNISIGRLLSRGIGSDLSQDINIVLKFNKNHSSKFIIDLINYVEKCFKIIGYTNYIDFKEITLIDEKSSHIGYVFKKQKEIFMTGKRNNLYSNDTLNKIFNNAKILDNRELRFINNEDENSIIDKFLKIYSSFEHNFKIKFPEYKLDTIARKEEDIIKQLLLYLNNEINNDNRQFIEGIKHKISTYKNQSYYQLIYTINYYDKQLKKYKSRIPFEVSKLQWLYYEDINKKTNNMKYAVKEIISMRNSLVHEDNNFKISQLKEFWIEALELITYCMTLDILGLTLEEKIDLLEMYKR